MIQTAVRIFTVTMQLNELLTKCVHW